MQKLQANLRLATINVRNIVTKIAEVTETVGRRVDVLALQEVCSRNKGVKTLRGDDFYCRLHWKYGDSTNEVLD